MIIDDILESLERDGSGRYVLRPRGVQELARKLRAIDDPAPLERALSQLVRFGCYLVMLPAGGYAARTLWTLAESQIARLTDPRAALEKYRRLIGVRSR